MSAATPTRLRSTADVDDSATGAPLTGTWPLIRFVLRRERLRIPVWIAALTATTVATAVSFGDLYPTAEARQSVTETMGGPAGIAMSGPSRYLQEYNHGSMMGHQMLGFVVVLAALMSVLMVVRHTRLEEETGRAELVRATVVGRHAHLAAALTVATLTNLLLGLALAVGLGGLGLEGMTWSGSWLYGAAHAAVGISFAAVAAVTVQITEHTRGASGIAFALLALAYVLRAAGDVGTGTLSWLSPIGWAQATYVYVDDRWWPLLLAVGLAALLVGVAARLSVRRDVGAGLRQTRPGAAAASGVLASPIGLALRLQRGMLLGFGVGMLLLGASYGSILNEVEAMIANVDVLGEAIADVGGATITESFVSMIMIVLAIFSSVYVVMATLRPRSEESSGRAEPLLATALSRTRWVGGHVVVAMVGGAGMLVLAGLGLGVPGAIVLADGSFVLTALGAALAYTPALWVSAGVAVVLFGFAPRAAPLAWVVPVYAFGVGYLGQILQLPEWMSNLSPFGHVPQLPADELALTPLLVLVAVAAALVALGLVGMRRRDLVLT